MGRISFGKVSASVCQMFKRFLRAFRGDIVFTLEFLMQRNSTPKNLSPTEPKEDLILEVEEDQVVRVFDSIDFFLSQHKLLSRSDAVEMLVLGSGIEWNDSNALKFASNHSASIIKKLNQDRLSGKFCDVCIIASKSDTVNSQAYHAHKCVLAATSEYFSEILKPETTTVTIPCLTHPPSFALVLEWIYAGAVMLDKENCFEIQKLAKFLRIGGLERACKDYFVLSNEVFEDVEKEVDFLILVDNEEDILQSKTAEDSRQTSQNSMMSQENRVNTNKRDNLSDLKGKPAETTPKKAYIKRNRGQREIFHICQICKASFQTKSHLKRHMISHTGERKHCCTTCGKLFLKADHLTRHERTHSTERPFHCDQCDKKFKTKDNLKKHLQTHSDERPFFCEICAKQFKDKSGLLIHQKSHSKSEPICPHCGKRFTQRNRLAYHIIRHTNPLSCKLCGKTFAFQNHLQRHTMTHTGDRPFSCETCGRQFVDGHGLKVHQKKHTGIGLHPCPHCERKFLDRFHLRRHMKMHTGEKPYKCGTCGKTFSRPDNCESHKKICAVKVAMRKDLRSFAEQEGETLKIKKVKVPKELMAERTSTVWNSTQDPLSDVTPNIAIAVKASELRTSGYKRIAKKPPELKLILLKNLESNRQVSEPPSVVQSNLMQYAPPTRTNTIQANTAKHHGLPTMGSCEWGQGTSSM